MVEGVLTKSSSFPFAETLERVEDAIDQRGLTIFTRIDHREGARHFGLEMQPATVLIFGNPQVGTPAMLSEPLAALELPLRLLIWEQDGQAQISLQEPAYLADRFGIPAEIPAHAKAIADAAIG